MKNKLIFLQVFTAVILICTTVNAALETGLGLTAKETTIKKGDTVEVTLSLKNVKEGTKIKSIEGHINYNKDVFEKINYDSIVKNEDKTVKILNETLPVEDLTNVKLEDMPSTNAYVGFNGSPTSDNDSRIVIDFQNGLSQDADLLTIKFKVKENAKVGDIENAVSCSNFEIVANNSERLENIKQSINLKIEEKGNANDDKNENKVDDQDKDKDNNKNKVDNQNKNQNKADDKKNNSNNVANKTKNTNRTVNNTNTLDNTVAGTRLPATGAKVLVIPAIILVALAYISYNKYIKMKGI